MIDFFCWMPDSASVSDCSASSRRSVLKMLNSLSSGVKSAPVSATEVESAVVPSANPCAEASLTPPSTCSSSSRLSVKSLSTCSEADSDTTATMSAGVSLVCT